MRGSKLNIDWKKPEVNKTDRNIKKFRLFLEEKGFRESTIENYLGNVKRYLKFSKTDHPSLDEFKKFRESLHSWKLSRNTLNQYGYSARAYHEMLGEKVEFTRIAPNNQIPFYFTSEDVDKIFSVIFNLKHLAMLHVLFYGCLRASELCNLNDEDLDLGSLSIRVNEGKGGKDGIAYINHEAASTLKEYLKIRPSIVINGQKPLFYTDYAQRWHRVDLHHMFTTYKKKAGIEKTGGLHVFARHTPATLMIANGCDIRIVKEVLRHNDIRTTLRYAHVSDKTKREKYEKYLVL
jgi:integrase/recombinase XerD